MPLNMARPKSTLILHCVVCSIESSRTKAVIWDKDPYKNTEVDVNIMSMIANHTKRRCIAQQVVCKSY